MNSVIRRLLRSQDIALHEKQLEEQQVLGLPHTADFTVEKERQEVVLGVGPFMMAVQQRLHSTGLGGKYAFATATALESS